MTTIRKDQIEFVLPGIYKATRRDWAQDFLEFGTLYFTNVSVFKSLEFANGGSDEQRGDWNEGKCVTIRQGVKCTLDHTNPIYVWCSTMESDAKKILRDWNDRDTVLQITDPVTFAYRIRDAVDNDSRVFGLQVGPVTYDKDEGSYHEPYFAQGIFQKNRRFDGQKEFRFAVLGSHNHPDTENIILNLGNCKDIARIAFTRRKSQHEMNRLT